MHSNKPLNIKNNTSVIIFNILSFLLFLFFIQQITIFIEAIYMTSLIHQGAGGKAFGILLLTIPIVLFWVGKSKLNYIIIVAIMLFCVLISSVLPVSIRIFSSGIVSGLFLLYFALQITDKNMPTANWGQAAALATLTSIAFRSIGHSLDISLSGDTKYIGWILVFVAVFLFYKIIKEYPFTEKATIQEGVKASSASTWFGVLGITGSILLIYFAFSSPAVIARWTEGNYILINLVLSISIFVFIFFKYTKIQHYLKLRNLIVGWNIAFLLLLVGTILMHRVSFPLSPESPSVVVGEVSFFSQLITYLMLLSSPVVFINITIFSQIIKPKKTSKLALPFFMSALLIILSILIIIYTNTWGYSEPISSIFRNQFHLPFLLIGIFMIIPYFFIKNFKYDFQSSSYYSKTSSTIAGLLVIVCCVFVFTGNIKQADVDKETIKEITVMTYNVQQGVNLFGTKNYEGQLKLIKEVNPDIIGLQESDGSRISGGNSDVVRYFSEKLGYYSYFGPNTVTGTYGTAILSRFPLKSSRTIFSYSTKDEVGTAVSNISVGNQEITIVNSHPAGRGGAKQVHIDEVANLAKENKMVIALGDYNFRQDSPYYHKITNSLNDAWISIYPNAIGLVDSSKLDLSVKTRKKRSSGILLDNNQLDMKNRIDHIFVSKAFKVVEAHYLPAPESGTDHPVHWAVLRWE